MSKISFCQTYGEWLEQHDADKKAETLAELEQRLKFWDKGANAIPDYVWHVINSMKEKNNE